jgi:hypothetical protein
MTGSEDTGREKTKGRPGSETIRNQEAQKKRSTDERSKASSLSMLKEAL